MSVEKAKVEKENAKAQIEADACDKIAKNAGAQKAYAEGELGKAGPLVEKALAALKSLDKKDFQQAKSFAKPKQEVANVFVATLYIISNMRDEYGKQFKNIEVDKKGKPKKATWQGAQIMLKDPEYFKNTLMNLKDQIDNNKVPKENIKPAKKIMKESPDAFVYEKVKGLSIAAAGLSSWVVNIVMYWDVIQLVVPLRKKVEKTQKELSDATAKLAIVMAIVKELNDKLAVVQAQYDGAMKTKADAEAEAKFYSDRLDLANRLLGALGSEGERWTGLIDAI